MPKLDKAIQAKIRSGRTARDKHKPVWDECHKMWKGEQYVYRTNSNQLVTLSTGVGVTHDAKPSHRIRLARNLLIDLVATEVAYANQRTPAYEIVPSTPDPEDAGAARLSQKIANYGHDKWQFRSVVETVVTDACVRDEGYAWPYFDNQIGKPIGDGLCEGDIKIRTYGPDQVFWQPGTKFMDSRWHGVECEHDVQDVKANPDYIGPKNLGDGKDKVMVIEYLERPSGRNPTGTWLVCVDDEVVCDPRDYPTIDDKGNPLDEPCLHKLSYFINPKDDRDSGLVRHCIDHQRVYNDVHNRILEWKNLALNPQIWAPVGSLKRPPTDEPGAINYYIPVGGMKPEWQTPPSIPGELLQIAESAKRDIQAIAGQGSNVGASEVSSGVELQTAIEKDQSRRAAFSSRLAEFYARLMRHCLCLVQKYYTEERLILIKGRFGWETIYDFKGADLRGQVDVTVRPGSVEPRTRDSLQQQIMTFAQMGWIGPEQAMAAIDQGAQLEALVDDYELDVAWQNYEIQQMQAIPTGHGQIPDARDFDNHEVHLDVLHRWQKTMDYANSRPEVQEAANLHGQQHEFFLAQQAAQQAQAQAAQAQALGAANAAKPSTNGQPSIPGGSAPVGANNNQGQGIS